MVFSSALIDRISKLVGIATSGEDEYSFFEPGGNDQFIQFLFLTLPLEYLELEIEDRYQLLLIELNDKIDGNFDLDETNDFAVLVKKNEKGVKSIQAVLDFRHQSLISLYSIGEPKACKNLYKKVLNCVYLSACFIDSEGLINFAKELEKISGIKYSFEQLPRMHLQPQSLTGTISGDLTQTIFYDQIATQPQRYNIKSLTGNTIDGAQGNVTFSANGGLHVDACKLGSFFKTSERLFKYLLQKYQILADHKLQKWDRTELKSGWKININPIIFKLEYPIDKVDGLIRHLTQAIPPLLFIGTWERVSRVLWKLMITEVSSGQQLNLEFSGSMIRIFLKDINSIPLVDKIESFIRGNISPMINNNHELPE
ncbi:MAG: hypothetical protein GY786_20405 [Proteobacteria bacterium]|nr:hypothetical protein [Pseudomonadota bacterium]